MPSSLDTLLTRFLAGLLAAIALQVLSIHLLSLAGALPWCWLPALAIIVGFKLWALGCWRQAGPEARQSLRSAWCWPGPWIIAALLLVQITLYPVTMADSLSYRLPRIFLALQEGGIGRFATPDIRMNTMPWGWEMMALPFASLNLVEWSRLVNLAVWLVVYQLLFSFALQAPAPRANGAPASAGIPPAPDPTRARWVALALATAPVMLLQSISTANDFYAGGLLLSGVWMVRRHHLAPGPLPVMGSLLALILAANVKPQFMVFGLPWLLWWAFAPGTPRRHVPWWGLAAAFPFYLLLSPLPLLAVNYHLTGGLMGRDVHAAAATQAPAWMMMVAGLVQFATSQLQLPVFPAAEAFSAWIRGLPGMALLNESVPKFTPGVQLIPSIDGASYGLIHATLVAIGFRLAIKCGHRSEWWWLAAAVFGVLIAASQFVPATIGRSFAGFIVLLLPAAAAGLASISNRRFIASACAIAILAGLACQMLNPSAPLWPSRAVWKLAADRGDQTLAAKLEHYNAYQLRAQVGSGILDVVPSGAPVAVLIREVTPVTNLWLPDWRRHRISYVNHITHAEFSTGMHQWLLIAENAKELYPEAFDAYSNLPLWERISEREYLPTLRQGPEIWTLYRKSGPGASFRQ